MTFKMVDDTPVKKTTKITEKSLKELEETKKTTPAMKQFNDIKLIHPDSILLFRMGDFYETFGEDAVKASKILGITLTARGKGETRMALAGIPYHALNQYLPKFINSGEKIVIVEQLEDPKLAKGVVKRGVVRIITPGTVYESHLISETNSNYLASLVIEGKLFGLTFADLSTGECKTTEINTLDELWGEIEKWKPKEVIISKSNSIHSIEIIENIKNKGIFVSVCNDEMFSLTNSRAELKHQFNNLIKTDLSEDIEKYFGIKEKERSISSCGAIIKYLKEKTLSDINHIQSIRYYSVNENMILDASTIKNLELIENIRDRNLNANVFAIINKTSTSMGARNLKKWLLEPLRSIDKINDRLQSISTMQKEPIKEKEISRLLKSCIDIERIISKIALKTINPKEVVALKDTIKTARNITQIINQIKKDQDEIADENEKINANFNYNNNKHKNKLIGILNNLFKEENILKKEVDLIEQAIKDEPSTLIRDGNIIKEKYNEKLDEIKIEAKDAKSWMRRFEEKEKEKTGIKSLKIKYNRVFGYFIEITKSNLHLVPENYIRKQTQVNAERFITEELKEKELLLLGANDRINAIEYDIYMDIVNQISKKINLISELSKDLSILDSIISLSKTATQNNYIKPEIHENTYIEIIEGRHPVVEIIEKSNFVSNDCIFNNDTMHIITGPNMAGKSTYLRQNAIIIILSHIGSFVPAKKALIPLTDRVFTRVGAYDDLSQGQSTFMVEMTETAHILHNASKYSFVVLDEIGRGTSTYDGFSLAWAISEYLVEKNKCKTLFATHYHQLNKLSEEYNDITNYNILVEEKEGDIKFLRKIVKGGTDKSYGVHVAELAGLPTEVIEKSKELMKTLEAEDDILEKMQGKRIEPKRRDQKTLN